MHRRMRAKHGWTGRWLPVWLLLVLWAPGAHATEYQTLFSVARSTNANVVHYDVRLAQGGALDLDDPLLAYWVLHAEDGRSEALTWFESQFAYGFSIDSEVKPAGFDLRLTAFAARTLRVKRHARGGFYAELSIKGRRARLESLYVKTREGGALPQVLYIDVFGRDLKTGKPVTQRLVP